MNFILKTINTLRKSLQNVSTSPCRRYMILTLSVLSTTSKQCFELTSSALSTTSKQCFEQPAASFLFCSLIFIEYKILRKNSLSRSKSLFIFLRVNLSKKSELQQTISLPYQENQWDKIVHSLLRRQRKPPILAQSKPINLT